MFTDIDVSGAFVVLCGDTHRTERVSGKYRGAAQLFHCSEPAALANAERFTLAVICADNAKEVSRWRKAITKQAQPALITIDAEPAVDQIGTVFLIGAGPSDPGLMTRRALEALSHSDVVLIDHLAPTADVQRWAPRAEIIDVGKVPGKHTVPQRQIDELMIERALAGQNVARVKGGDPYVFGRGTEELFVCERAGVPVEVISGVTSAISVPARFGVPMTLRKVSHAFTVVSGHAELTESELQNLAGLVQDGGTISILMGVRTLPHTVDGLLGFGVPASMPVAVFENGYRAGERALYSTLGRAKMELVGIVPPAIVVIGEVVDAGAWQGFGAVERREALLGRALS